METWTCNGCGNEMEHDGMPEEWDIADSDGETYCEDCYSTCDDCGGIMPSSAEYSINDGEYYVCSTCYDQGYTYCEGCNINIRTEDEVETEEGEYMCADCCARRIANVQTSIPMMSNQPMELFDPENFVQFCHECNDQRCSRCLMKIAKLKQQRETSLFVYSDIYRDSWHYSGHKPFKKMMLRTAHEKPYLYYGMELEVELKSGYSRDMVAKKFITITNGLFVAERDGSLNNGIEFISRPISYLALNDEEVAKGLKAGLDYLAGVTHLNAPTTGMHIHMSRKYFENKSKKNNAQAVVNDLNWIFQYFDRELEYVCGRAINQYCATQAWKINNNFRTTSGTNPTIMLNRHDTVITRCESTSDGNTHHDIINMTPQTIEFRMFRGTTDYEEVMGNIELCRALGSAARNIQIGGKTLKELLSYKQTKFLDKRIAEIEKKATNEFGKFKRKLEDAIMVKGNKANIISHNMIPGTLTPEMRRILEEGLHTSMDRSIF